MRVPLDRPHRGCGPAGVDPGRNRADAQEQKKQGWDAKLADPGSLRGLDPADVEKLIPDDWRKSPQKKGVGTKYVNPGRKGEQVLVEQGTPGAKDPLHAGPYIKISRNGTVVRVPLKGNPTLAGP